MVLRFFVLLILLTPSFGWSQGHQLSSIKHTAIIKKLWNEPQWLRLGHYRKKFLGGYESPLRGNFFIAPNGHENPESEILATIDLLFSDDSTARASQCRYLARTTWLQKALAVPQELLVPCPERDQWKEQLGATELYIVFASSDLNSAGSSFGHSFLRVHNPKNVKERELLDYGINYAAITGADSGALYAMKGLFGFYPGAYSMLPYYQKIQEYTNLEGRSLWEYKLNLTSEEVKFIIDHLLELEGSFAPYYFLSDNCSQQIIELIEVAKPDLPLSAHFVDATIPLDTLKVLRSYDLLQGEKSRASLQAEWRTRFAHLSHHQKNNLEELIKDNQPEDLAELSKKEQAEVLEAGLSYLSVKSYREKKELKTEKYRLSAARAQLGAQTEPLMIPPAKSPLLSPDSQALYFGFGQQDESDYLRFKYRRAFHDILADDSGLAPFSHLEILSAEFRYLTDNPQLDLYQLVLLKSFSTTPLTQLEKPVSWKVDLGTRPKFLPYLNIGAGYSWDVPFLAASRVTVLGVADNETLTERAQSFLGGEVFFMTRLWDFRFIYSTKFLRDLHRGRGLIEHSLGTSYSPSKVSFRLEVLLKESLPDWNLSVSF